MTTVCARFSAASTSPVSSVTVAATFVPQSAWTSGESAVNAASGSVTAVSGSYAMSTAAAPSAAVYALVPTTAATGSPTKRASPSASADCRYGFTGEAGTTGGGSAPRSSGSSASVNTPSTPSHCSAASASTRRTRA